MRLLDSVLGHTSNIEHFLSALEQGRLANTFLFAGPKGIGKLRVAQALSQALLCETSLRACGNCRSCLRVEKNQHESLRLIAPEKIQIKIEQTREILDFLSLQSLTPRRAVLIDDAEKLNPQAANSLLKILEEPNTNTYFFLIAPSPSHVLPTLRSRSQIMTFRAERVKNYADKGDPEIRALAVEMLKSWAVQPQGFLRPEFREAYRDRASAAGLGRSIAVLLRDAAAWKMGERDNLLNPDQTSLFAELEKRPLAQLLTTGQWALRLESHLAQNRDSQLLFEEFWIKTAQT